jgi:hypothetical protein
METMQCIDFSTYRRRDLKKKTGLAEPKVPSDPREMPRNALVQVDPWCPPLPLTRVGKPMEATSSAPQPLSWTPMHCADRQLPKSKCNPGSAHLMRKPGVAGRAGELKPLIPLYGIGTAVGQLLVGP